MRDVRRAEFVRWFDPSEDWREVVNEARADTWAHHREHALLLVERGLVLVRGGRDGIDIEIDGDERAFVMLEGLKQRIVQLGWHTHPIATGPSDQDREVLKILGQAESKIFEPGGSLDGVRFYRDTKGGTP